MVKNKYFGENKLKIELKIAINAAISIMPTTEKLKFIRSRKSQLV
jgi:hypothetical protein